MARVIISGSADADFATILIDLSQRAGPDIAAKFTIRFERLYGRLAHFPGIGSPRPGLGRNVRIIPVVPYVAIYRYADGDDIVSVVRIIHGRRNITRKLLRSASFS